MLSQNLTGNLIPEAVAVSNEDISLINKLPNPPLVTMNTEDIYVRRCRLANDQIDSRFGRFHIDDIPRLIELVQGAPVLIGHDRQSLGVARFFGGEVEKRGDTTWAIPKFYFPRAYSQSEDLRIMLDSGIYNEASIAFLYQKPTCNICDEDLRQCPHWPGKTYEGKLCFYWYDGIERVTEGSLVYRGAVQGTGFELEYETEENSTGSHDDEKMNFSGESSGRIIHIKHKGRRYTALLNKAQVR
ncbi:MAG: hypothetical protein P9L92_13210 [Candidatus Electryonea clarkiae]|nr:hypothetical protein [Candidatus Electryonea clarkiae]MDP8289227.1 hypothetical protein [Candidatus Electryonea clarkiae]